MVYPSPISACVEKRFNDWKCILFHCFMQNRIVISRRMRVSLYVLADYGKCFSIRVRPAAVQQLDQFFITVVYSNSEGCATKGLFLQISSGLNELPSDLHKLLAHCRVVALGNVGEHIA